MENKIEAGQRFGKLVVLSCHKSQNGRGYCFCKCDCGTKGVTAYYKTLLDGSADCCTKCKSLSSKKKKQKIAKE